MGSPYREGWRRNVDIYFTNPLQSSSSLYMIQLWHTTFNYQTSVLFSISFFSLYMKELFVNLDPMVLEVLYETKYLRKMHFEVPDVVLVLCAAEEQIKRHQREWVNTFWICFSSANGNPYLWVCCIYCFWFIIIFLFDGV